MNDTPPEIAALVRQQLLARSGAERLLMGVRMFDAARAMALPVLRQPDTNGQFSALERPTAGPAVGVAQRPALSTASAATGPGLA